MGKSTINGLFSIAMLNYQRVIMLWSPQAAVTEFLEHSHQNPRSARDTIFTSYHNLLAQFNRCLININKDQQKHQQNHAKIYQKPFQFLATGWSYYRLAEHFSWWGHGGTSSQAQKSTKKNTRFSEKSMYEMCELSKMPSWNIYPPVI